MNEYRARMRFHHESEAKWIVERLPSLMDDLSTTYDPWGRMSAATVLVEAIEDALRHARALQMLYHGGLVLAERDRDEAEGRR